ncbi:unnamed protein product, partial [Didymodactylos carnosus]
MANQVIYDVVQTGYLTDKKHLASRGVATCVILAVYHRINGQSQILLRYLSDEQMPQLNNLNTSLLELIEETIAELIYEDNVLEFNHIIFAGGAISDINGMVEVEILNMVDNPLIQPSADGLDSGITMKGLHDFLRCVKFVTRHYRERRYRERHYREYKKRHYSERRYREDS